MNCFVFVVMDAVKGVFRRATQSTREKMGNADGTENKDLAEVIRRLKVMERSCCVISEKVQKLAKTIEDVGLLAKDIGEEYKNLAQNLAQTPVSNEPAPTPEMVQLSTELSAFGAELSAKAQELGRELKTNAFDNLSAFVRDVPQLRAMEDDRKKKQLEHDFFKQKVVGLIKNPPKDHTRIPRNESILENWRQSLHAATEGMKQAGSNMWSNGNRSIDMAVYTVAMVCGNYFGYGINSAKNHFVNAKLPQYQAAPLLPPAPLPPAPASWQPPAPAPGQAPYAQPGFAQPQPHQYGQAQPQFGGQQPQFGQGSPQQGQQGFMSPQQQSPQNFGQQPSQTQPSQLNFGYDQGSNNSNQGPNNANQGPNNSNPGQQQQPQQWGSAAATQAQSAFPPQGANSFAFQNQNQPSFGNQQGGQFQPPQTHDHHQHQQSHQQHQQQPISGVAGWGAPPTPSQDGPPPPPPPSNTSQPQPSPESHGSVPSAWGAPQGQHQAAFGEQPPPPPQ